MILQILDCSTLQSLAEEIGARLFYSVIPHVDGLHVPNEGNRPARVRMSYVRTGRGLIGRIVDADDATFDRDSFASRTSNEYSTS